MRHGTQLHCFWKKATSCFSIAQGGAADIWKCFDQILQELAALLCVIAGMPTRVLQTYTKLMAKGADSKLFEHGCRGTIPQGSVAFRKGCPWA